MKRIMCTISINTCRRNGIPSARWRLIAGVRNNLVEVTSHGHLPVIDAADSSARYSAVDPVGGITFRASSAVNLYASYGKGFETPTLNDLAYRSVNGSLPGLNFGLKPARSDNYEVGVKAGSGRVRVNFAAFYIKTEDELAVLQNSGGRTVSQNIGETNRRGMELGADAAWKGGFSGRLAYTYIRAVVGQAYSTCIAAPCNPLANPGGPPPANYKTVRRGQLPAGGADEFSICRTDLEATRRWDFPRRWRRWGAHGSTRMIAIPMPPPATGWRICGPGSSRKRDTGGSANSPALITWPIGPMLVL